LYRTPQNLQPLKYIFILYIILSVSSGKGHSCLVHYIDLTGAAGTQDRRMQHRSKAGVEYSAGSVGDRYDNGMAEQLSAASRHTDKWIAALNRRHRGGWLLTCYINGVQ
jgi:hypothetical protein